jgi:8-oxo-dGTP pyrophosphatase MutT (NUDIX family)
VKRSFTVATFVLADQHVLLLLHRKRNMWLPPGGHIKPNELPDETAVREVWEETGIPVELVGEKALPIDDPKQLTIPQGIQIEKVSADHELIDLVYFARPCSGDLSIKKNNESVSAGWFNREDLKKMPITEEISLWIEKAFRYFR